MAAGLVVPRSEPARRAAARAVYLALFRGAPAAAVALAAVLLAWQVSVVRLPFQVNYEEGNILNAVNLIERGNAIYPAPGGLPVVINPYPPVYYYLCAAGAGWLENPFLFGRIISILATCFSAFLIGLMARRLGAPPAISIVAGACYYLALPARSWAILMRVDALAVALALAGFYLAVFARTPSERAVSGKASLARLLAAALLFSGALLTKHTMVAAPAAVVLAWALEGRRREAAWLASATGGLTGAAFLLLGWWTGGAFYIYMFATHADPSLPGKWFGEFSFIARTLPVAVTLAAWFTAERARHGLRSRALGSAAGPLALYFVLASIGTVTGVKLGSAWNHYLEFCAAALLAAGAAVARLREQESASRPARDSLRGLIGVALVAQIGLLVAPMIVTTPGWVHAAGSVVLAAVAAWAAAGSPAAGPAAHRRRALAAVLAAAVVIVFPGVWRWSLMLLSVWPVVLAGLAFALLLHGRPFPAAAVALAAGALARAFPAVAVPVFAVLWARRRAHAGLFALAMSLLVYWLSAGGSLFHSPETHLLTTDLLGVWLQQRVALLMLLGGLAACSGAVRLPALYLAASLGLALAFREPRFWLEIAVAAAVVAAAYFASLIFPAGRAAADDRARPFQGITLAPFALAAVLVQLVVLDPTEAWRGPGFDPQRMSAVYAAVAAAPDPVLVDHPGLLAAARKPMLLSNPFVFKQSSRYFPEEPLLAKLRAGEINLVVLSSDPDDPSFPRGNDHPAWSETFLAVLRRRYHKIGVYDVGTHPFVFFTPAAPSPAQPGRIPDAQNSSQD